MADNASQPVKVSLLKQSARAGWLLVSRTLAFSAFGILINWGLFAVLCISIWGRYCPAGNMAPHVNSGAGAALVLFILALSCSRAVIITGILLLLFPFLYFMVGKTRGIKAALASLAKDNRAGIHALLEPVLRSALQSLKPLSEAAQGGRTKKVSAFLSSSLDKTANLPRPMRWMLKTVLKKLKVARLVSEYKELSSGEDGALMQIQSRIDEGIDGQLQPGWGGAAVLVVVNAGFAGAVYWLVRG